MTEPTNSPLLTREQLCQRLNERGYGEWIGSQQLLNTPS
jgi:hypothetical protein